MTAASAELPPPEDTRGLAYQLAADLQGVASSASRTQLGQWDGQGVPGWVGEAEDAYTSSIQYLDGKLNSLVAALNHAVSQAWGWGDELAQVIDTEIPKLHDAWDEVVIWEAKEKQRYSDALETGDIDPGFAWIGKQGVEGYVRGYQNGLDVYKPPGEGDIDGQRLYGYENQAMRSVAADVIGPRSKGISISLGGTDPMYPGMQDEENARHLVVLDENTIRKLRGSGGVLVDLAFDGATPEKGSEGNSRSVTATDKLLFWASNGYAEDLRETMDQDARPDNPTSGVPGVTRSWAPIVETLFETPKGASDQLQKIIKERNEFWKPIAGAAGTMGAAAATTLTGATGGFVASSADATYQAMLDSLLPTDQDTRPVNQYGPTTSLMLGTLATVAAEELDFSQAPKVPSEYLRRNHQLSKAVGPGETILPVSTMDPGTLIAFQQYLTSGLIEWDFDEALNVMENRAVSTHAQNKEVAEEK